MEHWYDYQPIDDDDWEIVRPDLSAWDARYDPAPRIRHGSNCHCHVCSEKQAQARAGIEQRKKTKAAEQERQRVDEKFIEYKKRLTTFENRISTLETRQLELKREVQQPKTPPAYDPAAYTEALICDEVARAQVGRVEQRKRISNVMFIASLPFAAATLFAAFFMPMMITFMLLGGQFIFVFGSAIFRDFRPANIYENAIRRKHELTIAAERHYKELEAS